MQAPRAIRLARRRVGEPHNAAWRAGAIVDRIVREEGFIETGKAEYPAGRVAIHVTVWRPPRSMPGIVRNPLPAWQ